MSFKRRQRKCVCKTIGIVVHGQVAAATCGSPGLQMMKKTNHFLRRNVNLFDDMRTMGRWSCWSWLAHFRRRRSRYARKTIFTFCFL